MKQKELGLLVVAVGCGLAAAILTQRGTRPPAETVKVLVAAKELPAGQPFTAENAEGLLRWKELPRAALPGDLKDVVVAAGRDPKSDKEQLHAVVGKRLSRPMHPDEPINSTDVTMSSPSVFLKGKDTMSIAMSARDAAAGHVGPGSMVDILASLTDSDDKRVFTLLPDVPVLAVNGVQELKGSGVFPDMQNVSFAVDQRQAILLTLAKTRNCKLELLLRHPDAPARTDWKYEDTEQTLMRGNKGVRGLPPDGAPVPGTPVPPNTEVEPPKKAPDVVTVRTRDVAIHSVSGTVIARYEEVRPESNQWRFKEYVKLGGAPAAAN